MHCGVSILHGRVESSGQILDIATGLVSEGRRFMLDLAANGAFGRTGRSARVSEFYSSMMTADGDRSLAPRSTTSAQDADAGS